MIKVGHGFKMLRLLHMVLRSTVVKRKVQSKILEYTG